LPGKGGIQLTVIFPTYNSTLYNVEIGEGATHEEILAIMSEKTKLPPIHEDFVEMGPADWFAKKRITIQYKNDRPLLNEVDIVSRQTFLDSFDPTYPVLIETDGACSGNPGPGGWAVIICQGRTAHEMHGPDPVTSNNEMELRAIDEALKFLPEDFKGYIVIESDSENCIHTMRGRGQRWKKDNYVNLRGNKVKNERFVDSIITRIESLTVEYRKIEAHKGDPWNERADALAVMSRN
jgi:ribonuclease HI